MPLMHDLCIIGAGPIGATLALALADAGLDLAVLDGRPAGGTLRGDRALALSHGTRLILERIGAWTPMTGIPDAVSPILEIDVSQARSFGLARLTAAEAGVPALGYVVSYVAMQRALDDALARAGIAVRFGSVVDGVDGSPDAARITLRGGGCPLEARLAAVADGAGAIVAGIERERRDYAQVALVAKVWTAQPHAGVAYERFTPLGPVALLPEGDHYGLVWTLSPAESERVLSLPDREFLAALAARFGPRVRGFARVEERRAFPLALEIARPVAARRAVVLGNAAQTLHPVAGQGFNLGLRDAFELARRVLDAPREAIGSPSMLERYASARRADRYAGIAFTHGLVHLFGNDRSIVRWPRGMALALLDIVPPAKRVFTRAMLHGLR
jgi:2-octaprenyl-6-methoxyphenol hydroxylase